MLKNDAVFSMALATIAMVSTVASASTGLEGKYKVVDVQCSSGATLQNPPTPGETNSSSSGLTFTSDEIQEDVHSFYKYDSDAGAKRLQQIQDLKATLQSMPDGPQKEQMLKSMSDYEDATKRMISGLSCTSTFTDSYSTEGSQTQGTFQGTSKTFTSDCPMMLPAALSPLLKGTFELSGNSLTITNQILGYSSYCPQGDALVWKLDREN